MHDQPDFPGKPAGIDRRGALECMIWAGTGVLWTLTGGVPKSSRLLGDGTARGRGATGFSFLQISDSHVGFNKPANPDALGTLQEAIGKVKALPRKPAFMIHTGDITHLSKPGRFDNADTADRRSQARCSLRAGRARRHRRGQWQGLSRPLRQGHQGHRLVQLRSRRRSLHRPRQRPRFQGGRPGTLGHEQLAWLADDLKGKSASTPIVVFAHIPLWTVYADGAGARTIGRRRSPC